MSRYMVRIWVDVLVEAESAEAAKQLVRRLPGTTYPGVETYDEQVAKVWGMKELGWEEDSDGDGHLR